MGIDSIHKKIDFEPVISSYNNSLRGIVKIKGKEEHKFPNSAGSTFISKWVSHLRTILIGVNSLSKITKQVARRRIIANSHAFIGDMIIDDTIKTHNMTPLAEGFNNILIDSYLGLRTDGHLSNLMKGDGEHSYDVDEDGESMIE